MCERTLHCSDTIIEKLVGYCVQIDKLLHGWHGASRTTGRGGMAPLT